MLRLRWVNAVALCILLFVAVSSQTAVSVGAQSPDSTSPIHLVPRTKAVRERNYRSQHRISLVVQVTDTSGSPVTGLKPEDFLVLDNQKQQKAARFREVDAKRFTADIHVVVVLDAINDGGSEIRHLKKDLNKYLSERQGPLELPISLAYVSEGGVVQTQAFTDRGVIATQFAQFARRQRSPGCQRGEKWQGARFQSYPDCVNTHFAESLNALRKIVGDRQNTRKRTIVIWPGRGWPIGEDFGTSVVHQRGNYSDVLVDLMTDLREAQVTLDAISWDGFETPRDFLAPIMTATVGAPRTPDDAAELAMALPALAQQSGGQVFPKVKDFGNAMDACLSDARDFYVVSFDSVPAATADEPHTIEVKVDRPGVHVRTVATYYAQP